MTFAKKMLFPATIILLSPFFSGCDESKPQQQKTESNIYVINVERIFKESPPVKQVKAHIEELRQKLQHSADVVDKLYGEKGTAPSALTYSSSINTLNKYFDEERQKSSREVYNAIHDKTDQWLKNKPEAVVITSQSVMANGYQADITADIIRLMADVKFHMDDIPDVTVKLPTNKEKFIQPKREEKPAAAEHQHPLPPK
ncbi:OmpH family outer membrane protein [Intestinirhabdus alba]|jgi:Skp family chaperone for outer membrane proteins|uniref:Chaperone protein Skp n=1 Tax=Intestinirhabdus alba TaxID=2899544 RepID=A0A6L6IU49_9ENTR|nr:hypothetical protein [Intestinirhabdus alba]MTH48916.1 hypothetical protein [Intestinirhabdus alba]